MRAGDGADQVVGVVDIGDPVAQRLVHGVLQGAGAAGDRHDLGAEQLHSEHVGRLALDIGRAHVDDAVEAEQGANRRRGDAVLPGAGLGDDALLAHAPGEQDLAHGRIVDLVRAGVIEFVALEIDLGAAEFLGDALGIVKRARPADVVFEVIVELVPEGRVRLRRLVGFLDLENQRHQGLGDVASAKDPEVARLVGAAAECVEFVHRFVPLSFSAPVISQIAGSLQHEITLLDLQRSILY